MEGNIDGLNPYGRLLSLFQKIAPAQNSLIIGEWLGKGKIRVNETTFEEGEYLIDEALTDHEVEVSFTGWETEYRSGGTYAEAFASHNHDIKAQKRKMTIHSTLKKGDAILCYQFGDEQYVVIGKVV